MTADIPGFGPLRLDYLVLDFNGTLAVGGKLRFGVRRRLKSLRRLFTIHVVTGDTHGTAAAQLRGLGVLLHILPSANQAEAKAAYVDRLGAARCACVGNGRNDRLMLGRAALGVAVVEEGAAAESLAAAKVVCPDIFAALALVGDPRRLTATLRA